MLGSTLTPQMQFFYRHELLKPYKYYWRSASPFYGFHSVYFRRSILRAQTYQSRVSGLLQDVCLADLHLTADRTSNSSVYTFLISIFYKQLTE